MACLTCSSLHFLAPFDGLFDSTNASQPYCLPITSTIFFPYLRNLACVITSEPSREQTSHTMMGQTIVAATSHWSAVSDPPAGTPISEGSRPRYDGICSYGSLSELMHCVKPGTNLGQKIVEATKLTSLAEDFLLYPNMVEVRLDQPWALSESRYQSTVDK